MPLNPAPVRLHRKNVHESLHVRSVGVGTDSPVVRVFATQHAATAEEVVAITFDMSSRQAREVAEKLLRAADLVEEAHADVWDSSR